MIIHVVDLDGVKRTYEVTPMDLLDSIKDTSADDIGMPRETINLKDEDGFPLVDDDATLEKLKIVNEDTLYMFYHIHVVDYDGKKHTFKVKPNDDVEELKKLIRDATGISVSDQTLLKADKSTRVSSDKLYSDNGVVHDETLYMQPPCPSESALNFCHQNGKSKCNQLKSCTWCPAKRLQSATPEASALYAEKKINFTPIAFRFMSLISMASDARTSSISQRLWASCTGNQRTILECQSTQSFCLTKIA